MTEHLHDPEVEDLLGAMTEADRARDEPPSEVWQRIEAELDGGTGSATAGGGWSSRPVWFLVAAIVISIAVFGLSTIRRPAADVLASAELVGGDLPDALVGVTASAVLDGEGQMTLDLTEGDLPEGDGFYELWVIRPDLSGMYSLGVAVDGGSYAIPEGVEPNEYSIVDISREPLDGQPTHSGISVLRGSLS